MNILLHINIVIISLGRTLNLQKPLYTKPTWEYLLLGLQGRMELYTSKISSFGLGPEKTGLPV